MSSNPRSLLRAAVRTLAPDSPADSDAELLGRYVAARDQDAFAALVRRHGPMVHAVCRRRLRGGPDADDAFQITFMVLARDAAKVARRESLPGWLYRVAYLVALKLAGKAARREADPLMDHDAIDRADPQDEAAAKELNDALDQELAALPDRLRAVVVLCGLEERTNAEAAKLLGCPVGTVDSRLSAARKALKARLTRRGLALTGGVTLEALLRPGPAIALGELIDRTAFAAVAYAAGGAGLGPLSTIADGVTPIMGFAKLKLLAVAGMSLALFGTAGLGLVSAPAGQEKGKGKPTAEAKADPPKEPEEPKTPPPAEPAPKRPVVYTEQQVRDALAQPSRIQNLTTVPSFDALATAIQQQTGVFILIDYAAFKRVYEAAQDVRLGESKLPPIGDTAGMTNLDLLNQAVAFFPVPSAVQVRGNKVVIVPAFQPAVPPSIEMRTTALLVEQTYGPPVHLGVRNKPLSAVLESLRDQTGANIVFGVKDTAAEPVTLALDDVRLRTALTVLADMSGLRLVVIGNVYYITTPENAARMEKEADRDLFGEKK
ncbi:MAG TPA: RNA polymerase sigma factor [Fimbriiglobus sp.]|nr:RNA polymerase sigma factor [Fimbriiglobus sp.]